MSYPGLPGDRYHDLAKRYCPKGAGAVFTFGLKGGYDAGVKLVSNVKLFSHLANIGDTRSLIIHPASTTHRQLSDAQKVAGRRRPRRGAALGRASRTRTTSSPISIRDWRPSWRLRVSSRSSDIARRTSRSAWITANVSTTIAMA